MNKAVLPFPDGGRVVIIGGGPAGTASAIALLRLAQRLGRRISVTLYEGKIFAGERHYNQCVGVVSPPIWRILEEQLGIPFPWHLVQRRIVAYVLHGEHRSLVLEDPSPEPSYALRRVQFDAYLLERAEALGTEVVHSRVTDIEISEHGVLVYSESDNREADVLVAAFGLDLGTAAALARVTRYRPPRFLDTMVTKIHPPPDFPELPSGSLEGIPPGRIHVFFPPTRDIEFGAVSPKGNHLTINIAGARVSAHHMDQFLFRIAQPLLAFSDPQHPRNPKDFRYFKGRFPISVAKGFFGDRYVVVGDAAGLVRAFKGKGINSACETAAWAAESILTWGISAEAFRRGYLPRCRAIIRDIPYGRLARQVVIWTSFLRQVDRALALAEKWPPLRQALFAAVSGSLPYRDIVRDLLYALLRLSRNRHKRR